MQKNVALSTLMLLVGDRKGISPAKISASEPLVMMTKVSGPDSAQSTRRCTEVQPVQQ